MNPSAHPHYVKVENVTKQYGKFTALKDVSFTARSGEFISVLGPSGCGKTTLLRLVAGLESLTEGRILIQGRDVSDLPVSHRNVGIVFQSYALFPNLSAADNIAYGLRGRKNDRSAIRKRVQELLNLVGLSGIGTKYPAQLSGGQQQRVALARAMALSPDLLLLDEPLSALDAKVRGMLRSEIRQLQQRLGVTTIMVTHDQEEALTMADRILVICEGRLVQNGKPADIYDRPATPFVASFIGSMNFIPEAVKIKDGCYQIGDRKLMISGENGSRSLPAGHFATLAIRPEDIMIHADGENTHNVFQAQVKDMEYRGPLFRITLDLALRTSGAKTIDADVTAEKVRRFSIRENALVSIRLPQDRLRVYQHKQVAA